MTAFRLEVQLAADETRIECTWYGKSALRSEETLSLPRARDAAHSTLPERFAIDLTPLRAEVAAGLIPDAAALAAADDLLPLRDLLEPAAYLDLCEALFLFLWRAARKARPAVAKGPDGRAWADYDRRLVRVWFATNRKRVPTGEADPTGVRLFSDTERASGLQFGRCSVFIPVSHKPGSTGTAWWRRLIWFEADDTLEVRKTVLLPESDFWTLLAGTMAREWSRGERNLFVLIHGYNVDFAEAAIRAAQIGYDLKVPGEMAFYSWPSRGGMLDYLADEATITASVGPLAEFLEGLRTHSGAERIHLFVHSMGNRVYLSALERLASKQSPPLRLGQVFFCAPDEDVDVFAEKTQLYPQECENRTLLVSPQDWAVALSRLTHQYNRVGKVPPFRSYPGIETVAVTGFGLLNFGHGYFAESEPVIRDLRRSIEARRRPGERPGPRSPDGHYLIDIRVG